jgi:hypothetical protein
MLNQDEDDMLKQLPKFYEFYEFYVNNKFYILNLLSNKLVRTRTRTRV